MNLEYDECGQSEPMIALRPYTRTTSIAIPCSTSNLICCHQLRFAAYEVDLHCWGLDLIVRGLNFSIDMLDLVEKRVSFLTSAAHPVKLKWPTLRGRSELALPADTVLWTINHSANGRNHRCIILPRWVFRGVIYIFAGKATTKLCR